MQILHLNENSPEVKLEHVLKQLKDFPFDDEDMDIIRELTEEAAEIADPKAFYKKAEITELGGNYIIADGVKFTSALLRENVSKCSFVVAYTATCGRELYEWAKGHQLDVLEMYTVDVIMELYLRRMFTELNNAVRAEFYGKNDVSSMAPGSLDAEWPITQQKQLFALLGEPAAEIGIELTDSCLMIPQKSASGIYFSADQHFESCMLCTRLDCPNRRAKYKYAK